MSQKHGNSVTNLISSLLWISIVIPNFKSHNIIMSARVYSMKRVKDCKDESIMSPQDEQWRRTSLLCLYTVIFLFSDLFHVPGRLLTRQSKLFSTITNIIRQTGTVRQTNDHLVKVMWHVLGLVDGIYLGNFLF